MSLGRPKVVRPARHIGVQYMVSRHCIYNIRTHACTRVHIWQKTWSGEVDFQNVRGFFYLAALPLWGGCQVPLGNTPRLDTSNNITKAITLRAHVFFLQGGPPLGGSNTPFGGLASNGRGLPSGSLFMPWTLDYRKKTPERIEWEGCPRRQCPDMF